MMTLIHRLLEYIYYNTHHNVAIVPVVGSVVVIVGLVLSSFVVRSRSPNKNGVATTTIQKVKSVMDKDDTKPIRKNNVVICPFSQGSDFMIESADSLPLTPLEAYEDWVIDYLDTTKENVSTTTPNNHILKPLAARWLNMGMSGQDTPGTLRAGLRRLRNAKYFLVEESHRLGPELLLKKKAFDDLTRHPFVYVEEADSLDAQRECLALFLEYLPRRYTEEYTYDSTANTITVKCIDTTFHVEDWYNTRPLELCERIVQEDLVLMRPPTPEGAAAGESYRMAAAAVVFSFDELQQKLGQPVEFLHAPVPGYEKHIRKSMNFTFSKLKVEQPMWRNKWGISPSAELDKPLYGSSAAQEQRTMSADGVTEETIKAKFLKVEYQTIRRLPKSSYLLFTINTMVDPIHALETVPPAASCLAASIRGMSPAMRKYKGIDNDEICEAVLKYLDSIGAPQEIPPN
jgi:dimethylamine monooxygenase subunit A